MQTSTQKAQHPYSPLPSSFHDSTSSLPTSIDRLWSSGSSTREDLCSTSPLCGGCSLSCSQDWGQSIPRWGSEEVQGDICDTLSLLTYAPSPLITFTLSPSTHPIPALPEHGDARYLASARAAHEWHSGAFQQRWHHGWVSDVEGARGCISFIFPPFSFLSLSDSLSLS